MKILSMVNAVILITLFCVTFFLVWTSRETTHLNSQLPASISNKNIDPSSRSSVRKIFDTSPVQTSPVNKAIMEQRSQEYEEYKKKADAIIADTDKLIQEYSLDEVAISDDEKQKLIHRQAQLRKRLEALKDQ